LGAIAILLAMASGDKKHEVAGDRYNTKNDIVKTEKKSDQHEMSSVIASPETKDIQEGKIQNEVVSTTVMHVTENNDDKLHTTLEPYTNTVIESTDQNSSTKKTAEGAEGLDQLETEELLLMAREAYWNNGLDEAAQIYQQLIKREPQVIEHKGELGNVYWRQGYPKKAAELYSEIAIPLIESGSSERVTNMVGFIQLFYPDRVEVIMDRLKRSDNKATQ
jgi:hypothetical protein